MVMDWIKYILLGIIQGITEILPISSSGHLVLFQYIFDLKQPGLAFEMFTNMASLIAMVVLFYKDIWHLISQTWRFIFKKDVTAKADFLYVIKLLIAVIPIGILGFILKDWVGSIKSLWFVGLALMLTGTLLLLIYRSRNQVETHDEVTYKDALFIGLTQAIAIFPGVSRSGSTIIGGLSQRLSLKSLLKFSFLCYIIVSIPASLLAILDLTEQAESIDFIGYGLAFLFTLITTYLAAYFVMKKLQIKHLLYFGLYCVSVGLIAFVTYFLI
jgi:undecaprenyl-diphosphatase